MGRTAGSNLDEATKQRIIREFGRSVGGGSFPHRASLRKNLLSPDTRQLLNMDIPVGVVAARMNLSYMTVWNLAQKKCQF